MGTTGETPDQADAKDWGAIRGAAVALVVGAVLAGIAVFGGVWTVTSASSSQQSRPALVSFGSDDVDFGEYYVPFRLSRSSKPPPDTMCLPLRPRDTFRRCFAPSGVATERELSDADAEAVADATAKRLRESLGDSVQNNDVTIENVVQTEGKKDDGWWSWTWTGIAGVISIITLAWGFWTGRAHLDELRQRLRKNSDSSTPPEGSNAS